MDLVAGVGPITIDSSCQGQRVGRALMQDVIDYARRNHIEQVRLFIWRRIRVIAPEECGQVLLLTCPEIWHKCTMRS